MGRNGGIPSLTGRPAGAVLVTASMVIAALVALASPSAALPVWEPVVTVAGPDEASRSGVELALTPDGEPAILWYEYASHGHGMYFRWMVDGVWQPPELVTHQGDDQQLAIDNRGVVTVLFQRWRDGFGPEIVAKRRTLRGVWTRSIIISPVTKDDGLHTGASGATLQMNAAGDAVASWSWGSYDGGPEPRDQLSYRPAGDRWSAPRDLNPRSRLGDLAIGPDGTATIAYVNQRGLMSMQRRSGRWQPPALISRRGTWDVALTNRGKRMVYAVWSQPTPTGREIRLATLRSGRWSPSERLGGGQTRNVGPEVTVDRAGTVTVAWLNGPDRRVQAIRRSSTGEREPVRGLSGPGARFWVTLAGNAAGDTVAAWTVPLRETENRYDRKLEVAYRSRGATEWSPPFDASEGEPVEFSGTQPAITATGQASIAWAGGTYPDTAVRVRQTAPSGVSSR